MLDTKTLKPGDKVAVRWGSIVPSYEIVPVTNVSPTGRVKIRWGGREHEFNADCRQRGRKGWDVSSICAITPDILHSIRRSRLLIVVHDALKGWHNFPTDTLAQLAHLLCPDFKDSDNGQ